MGHSEAEAGGESRARRYAGRALRQLRAERGWSQRTFDRRQFLSLTGGVALTGVASGATVFELLRVTGPTRTDDLHVEELRGEVEAFHATYATTAPAELLVPVSRRLQQVTSLLHEPQPLGMRARLCRLGGELGGLRGRLAAHTEEPADAGMWYRLALSLATEDDESLLAGWITGAHALSALYEGDHARARQLVGRGLALTAGSPASPTRAWLFLQSARAEAGLGHQGLAREALRRAHEATDPPAPGERRYPMTFDRDDLRLEFGAAVALKLVGELREAERALDAVLNRRREVRSSRTASILELEKADLHLRRGQPDEAAHLAATALEALPREEVIAPIVSRVDQLRAGLRPWSDATAVRHLDETWAALTA